jgi:hypothetical protein
LWERWRIVWVGGTILVVLGVERLACAAYLLCRWIWDLRTEPPDAAPEGAFAANTIMSVGCGDAGLELR